MPTYSLHIPPIPGQPQTVGEALGMPSSQPQRTTDTIDWNKEQIGWNKDQITDLHARIEQLESREQGQNQLIAHIQSEKYALEAEKISFETSIEKRLASFREQVDIQGNQIKFLEKENAFIKQENSSIREENASIKERLSAYEGMDNSRAPKEKLSYLLDSWRSGKTIDQNEFLKRLSYKLDNLKEFIDQNTPPRSPQQDLDLN